MHGWRGRLGLIVPSSNTVNESEFANHLPRGVSLHTGRISLETPTPETLSAMADGVGEVGELLGTADVDVAAYGCTTGSLVEGPGYETEIERRLSDAVGAPSVATAASIKHAFRALDVESLAIATPYVEELNERERSFLADAGYEIVDFDGLGIETGLEIGRLRPDDAYRQARSLDHENADAIFVSCTNYRTFEMIDTLEADVGKPVITSNQATLWDALREIGVDYSGLPLGTLFDLHAF
jgi:maleate isomerase